MFKSYGFAMIVHVVGAALSLAQIGVPQNQQPGVPPAQPPQTVPGQSIPGRGIVNSQPATAQQSAGQLDQAIASCLALGNQEEVALAEFAKDKVKNDRVKQFADTMQKQHKEALQKLQQIAPATAEIKLSDSSGAASVGQSGRIQSGQFTNQTGQAGGQPVGGGMQMQMLALQRQMAQECLKLTKEELGKHDGADFDRCYMGQQMGAHVGMLAKLRASESFASGQLKSAINEMAQTTEHHLEMAKKITKDLEDNWMNKGDQQASRNKDASAR